MNVYRYIFENVSVGDIFSFVGMSGKFFTYGTVEENGKPLAQEWPGHFLLLEDETPYIALFKVGGRSWKFQFMDSKSFRLHQISSKLSDASEYGFHLKETFLQVNEKTLNPGKVRWLY